MIDAFYMAAILVHCTQSSYFIKYWYEYQKRWNSKLPSSWFKYALLTATSPVLQDRRCAACATLSAPVNCAQYASILCYSLLCSDPSKTHWHPLWCIGRRPSKQVTTGKNAEHLWKSTVAQSHAGLPHQPRELFLFIWSFSSFQMATSCLHVFRFVHLSMYLSL